MYQFNIINLTDEKFKEGNVKFNTSTLTFGDSVEHQLFNTDDSSTTSNKANIITNQPVFEMLEIDENGFPSIIFYCGLVFLANNNISKRDKDFLEQTVNWQQQSETFVITSGKEYVISERKIFRPTKIVLFNLSIPNARVGDISGGASVSSGNFHDASSGSYSLPTNPTAPNSDQQITWWQKTLLVIALIIDIMGQALWAVAMVRMNVGDIYKGLFKIPLWIIDKLTGGKYKLVEKYDAFLEKTGLVTAESAEKKFKESISNYKESGKVPKDLEANITKVKQKIQVKNQEIQQAKADGKSTEELDAELEKLKNYRDELTAEKKEIIGKGKSELEEEYQNFLEEGGEDALDEKIGELETSINTVSGAEKTALKNELKTLKSKKEVFESAKKADRETLYGNDGEELQAKLNKFFEKAGDKKQQFLDKLDSTKTKAENLEEDGAAELDEELETQFQSILDYAKEKNLKIEIGEDVPQDVVTESDKTITNSDEVETETSTLIEEASTKSIQDLLADDSSMLGNLLNTMFEKLTNLLDELLPYKEQIEAALQPYLSAISTRISSTIDSWTRGMEKEVATEAETEAEDLGETFLEEVEDTVKTTLEDFSFAAGG